MTDTTATRVAPAAEGPQLTEHVNVLMNEETRAFLLGSKIRDEVRSEAAVARALIEDAICDYRDLYPDEYGLRVEAGRRELARRAGPAA